MNSIKEQSPRPTFFYELKSHMPEIQATHQFKFLLRSQFRFVQRAALALAFTVFSFSGCGKHPESSDPSNSSLNEPITSFQFENVTAKSKVHATYRNGSELNNYSILESLGGGVGMVDFDGDGQLDLLLPSGGEFRDGNQIVGHHTRLFRNLGSFVFDEVTQVSKMPGNSLYTHGCSAADFDNDGFQDVVITGYGQPQLLHNCGDGTFQEVQLSAGLIDGAWGSSAGWGDLNNDGLVDLYIAHYVNWSFDNHPHCPSPFPEHDRDVCPPRTFSPLQDIIFFNTGEGGFRNGTEEAGLGKEGKGLGVLLADFDHDSDTDIYVANDTTDNFLYLNDGTGRFTENAMLSGAAVDHDGTPNGSMGLALCDFNSDGRPDIWVTNYEKETFALYRNEGQSGFTHVSREAGVTVIGDLYVGFGTAAGDLDRDGDEDIVVTNGHVIYYPTQSSMRQLPVLLQNTGNSFYQKSDPPKNSYFSQPHPGRGLAMGDLDNDGRLDLCISHLNEPVSMLANKSVSPGSWVRLRLVGTKSNRNAIGARVVLHTTRGDQLRHISGGGSYLSQNDPRLFWGVPSGAQVTGATIHWPSGRVQTLKDLLMDSTQPVIESSH